MKQEIVIRVFSLVLLLIFWQSMSWWLQDTQILPSPWQVTQRMIQLWQEGELQRNLFATTMRVIMAFIFAMTIGTALGFVMGRSTRVNAWLDPWLLVFLNLPALVLIVLCYLWIGLNEIAAVLAVTLNKVPLVMTIIREGSRNASSELHDLSYVFRLSYISRLRHIILPELYPSLVSASRAGLSVIWKIVLVVEFLGRSLGIGRQIHTQFSIFNVTGVLAYALSFVILVMLVEFVILQPLEKHANRWRNTTDT